MDNKIYASEIQFVNLTDHEIRLGDGMLLPRAPKPARVLNERRKDGSLVIEQSEEVIPIYRFESHGQFVGLPGPRPGTLYIVSSIVRRELTQRGIQRSDVLSPYAIESRVEEGRRVPCARALAR